MSSDLAAIVVCGAATAALAALGPLVMTRLPEPEPDPEDEVDPVKTEPVAPRHEPKVLYADLAARPRLALWLAVAGAVVGGVVGWQLGLVAVTPAWVFFSAVGVVLSYIDWETRYLPTRIIYPSLAVLVVLVLVAFAIDQDAQELLGSVYGWAVFGFAYYALWWIYPSGLAFGDVRFSGLLGVSLGYLGWSATLSGLYLGFLAGGIGGGLLSALKLFDRKHYPFGPFMFAGALLGLLWGHGIAGWYSSI
jgi:leader peptidase (prepilin peptidase)/N-methyltransferase